MVERKLRHVVETGLTLLAQASLPLKFRSEAFNSVVFLINRMPTKVLDGISPLQKLYNIKPDYNNLKTFGCLCFPYLKPLNSNKFDYKSKPCTLIGYCTNQKGYKCIDPSGRIFISRHVIFDEKIFPYKNSKLKTSKKIYNPKVIVPEPPIIHGLWEKPSGSEAAGTQAGIEDTTDGQNQHQTKASSPAI